jgi:hypothetical protein
LDIWLRLEHAMAIEREQLRAWVYDALARPPQQVGGNQQLQLSDIARWVKQRAQQNRLLPQDTQFASNNLEKTDEDAIRECIWGLTIQGIVVPGSSNDSSYQANLPWLQVTQWGKTCLEKGEYLPYDTGLFLGRIRKQIPQLDAVVQLYLKEALNSFGSGNYLRSSHDRCCL